MVWLFCPYEEKTIYMVNMVSVVFPTVNMVMCVAVQNPMVLQIKQNAVFPRGVLIFKSFPAEMHHGEDHLNLHQYILACT